MKYLLRLLGYEINPTYNNSLIFMHMMDVTHETYFEKRIRHGNFDEFLIKK